MEENMRASLLVPFAAFLFPNLMGCEGEKGIPLVAMEVTATAEDGPCPEGWDDANNDNRCGIEDLSFQFIASDDESMSYLHPELFDGTLSALVYMEHGDLEPVGCNGYVRDHDYLYTTHFSLVVVQADEAPLPEEVIPVMEWTVELADIEDPAGYTIRNNFSPQLITITPPDPCINLDQIAGEYKGGGGWILGK